MIDKEFAISYLLDDCDDCPENKDGECITESHCFEVKQVAIKAIRQMIPDNATNGDVIKTLFPFVTKHISHSENNIYIDSPIQVTVLAFDRYWWNAPYKGAEE